MENKRNLVLGGVAVVLIAVAVYMFLPRRNVRTPLQNYNAHGICLNCKAESPFTADLRTPAPFRCPSCGEEAVYPVLSCGDCGTRFVADLQRFPGQPPRSNPFPTCPKCNCTTVSAWDPAAASATDPPILPKWP